MSKVKPRYDGKGDAWANTHRETLGNKILMNDVDGLFGSVMFGQNTENSLFVEYEPDAYKNHGSSIRKFGIVGLFDRKLSAHYALSSRNTLALAVYLYLCRVIATAQPVPPKFLFVIGKDTPPWTMFEVDINTGKEIGSRVTLTSNRIDWQEIWKKLGLFEIRRTLRGWTGNV